MNHLIQIFLGYLNLALPFLILYQLYPHLALHPLCITLYYFCIGFYVAYVGYKQSMAFIKPLQFIPSGAHGAAFEETIRTCSLDPANVHIRYAYSNEGIAQNIATTITIDPLLWKDILNDPAAAQAKAVINEHLIPTLSICRKKRLELVKALLTTDAQNFIFKHELGHLQQQFFYKKLTVNGIIGFITACAGVTSAFYLTEYTGLHGLFCIAGGLICAFLADHLATYASHILFVQYQERSADRFAVQFSTPQEIEAAASFFEQHQVVLDNNKETMLECLPSVIRSGHPHGATRARYLRKWAHQKSF